MPDRSHSAWIDFGFCYCRDDEWKIRRRFVYFKSATSASLEEMAAFWKSQKQLNGLFKQKRTDITDFKRKSIVLGRPKKTDPRVYRLVLEIDHIHRGRICACEHTFNPYPKSCLSFETIRDYGFDGSNSREWWQMVLLYQELFDAPKFDTHEVLVARRSADLKSLQKDIEKMVDVKKYWNIYKTDHLFPNLRSRLNWDRDQIPLCYCISHCGILRQH